MYYTTLETYKKKYQNRSLTHAYSAKTKGEHDTRGHPNPAIVIKIPSRGAVSTIFRKMVMPRLSLPMELWCCGDGAVWRASSPSAPSLQHHPFQGSKPGHDENRFA